MMMMMMMILTWLIQKLPRSEEERTEEVLGANALINRRISKALTEWKQKCWILPEFSDVRNFVKSSSRTATTLHANPTAAFGDLVNECITDKISTAPTLFERHVQELLHDATYSSFLENDFDEDDLSRRSTASVAAAASSKAAADRVKAIIRNAISNEKNLAISSTATSSNAATSSLSTSSTDAAATAGGNDAETTSLQLQSVTDKMKEMKLADQMNSSLQDLIASIGQGDADAQSCINIFKLIEITNLYYSNK
jgi:hypothetical protein